MKTFLAALVTVSLWAPAAFALDCDKQQAQLILDTMQKNYSLKYDDSGVSLHIDINGGWDSMNIDRKNRFLRLIADSDACIHDKARGIFIYSWGDKVAEASPLFGLKVIK